MPNRGSANTLTLAVAVATAVAVFAGAASPCADECCFATADAVNIRAEPTFESDVIGRAEFGRCVAVAGGGFAGENDEWRSVRACGAEGEGWVLASLVSDMPVIEKGRGRYMVYDFTWRRQGNYYRVWWDPPLAAATFRGSGAMPAAVDSLFGTGLRTSSVPERVEDTGLELYLFRCLAEEDVDYFIYVVPVLDSARNASEFRIWKGYVKAAG